MKKFIISLDQGTSSCRAILVNESGQIEGIKQQEFKQHFPKPGWVEHDPNEIWQTQMKVLDALINAHDLSAEQIISIGITNQRETTVVWNRHTGDPVYHAIVWQDKRTSDICEWIKSQKEDDYIYKQTGLVVDAYFSGTKVKWILDQVEGARSSAEKGDLLFGTIDTWLVWKMTEGRAHVTDYTNASRTLLFNIRSKTWDQYILDLLKIPADILPSVQSSASHFGDFNYKGKKIPISGIAGDQQAALFGQACFKSGQAKNTYGTGCFLLMNVGDKALASKNGLLTTLACDEQGEVCYALEGSIFIAGAAVQWLRDGLKVIKESTDTEAIAMQIKDEHDVVVVPAFAGLGAPYWNMYARGAIFGLTRGSEDRHLVKATLDALAYQTRDVLDAMEKDAGAPLEELKVDGGACANDYLMQFQSDILQTPVERPKVVETTALGAAYLAGMTEGVWDANVITNNRNIDQTFHPKMKLMHSEKLYGQWQKAVNRTINWIDHE